MFLFSHREMILPKRPLPPPPSPRKKKPQIQLNIKSKENESPYRSDMILSKRPPPPPPSPRRKKPKINLNIKSKDNGSSGLLPLLPPPKNFPSFEKAKRKQAHMSKNQRPGLQPKRGKKLLFISLKMLFLKSVHTESGSCHIRSVEIVVELGIFVFF